MKVPNVLTFFLAVDYPLCLSMSLTYKNNIYNDSTHIVACLGTVRGGGGEVSLKTFLFPLGLIIQKREFSSKFEVFVLYNIRKKL